MKYLIRIVLISALISSPPVFAGLGDSEIGPRTKLKKGHGIVMARVADASDRTMYPFNYLTFAPKELHAKKKVKFVRVEGFKDGASMSSTYAGMLPAGQYSLTSLFSFYEIQVGNIVYLYKYPVFADPSFGTFTVEAGKITNLGTIIYYPKFDGDDSYKSLARNNSFHSAAKVLKTKFPNVAQSIADLDAPLSWDKDEHNESRRLAYVHAAQKPYRF